VFGDFELVISWMENQLLVQSATLLLLYEQLKENTSHLNQITYTHVYRELSALANAMSKDSLLSPIGEFTLEEVQDGF
jgi:hypothetical protein